jgi:phospholipase/carboxylesterase
MPTPTLPLSHVERVPSGRDGELPLVICLHGRGADANDLADLAPVLDGGYRFLFPNAPKKFEPMPGYSMGWTWFEGWPPTPASIAGSRKLLLDFIDAALAAYPTPVGKVALSGFSQGAMMALDGGFRTAQPIAGIAAMSGALYETEMVPLKQIPTLIAHGTEDDVIPVKGARRTRHYMEQRGVIPEYHEFPIGHFISAEEIEVVREFLAHRLL